MEVLNAVVTGIGAYVPDYILTNEELSRMVDTNDEWIMTRVGIKERRILKDDSLGSSYLGTRAVQDLFARKPVNPDEIDAVICATSTADYHFPATAAIIANNVGLNNAFAFDIQAACSGFLVALNTAAGYIKSGMYKKILVVAAEKMSSMTDYTDRSTCPLFGDAGGAALVECTTENVGVMDAVVKTDGKGQPHLFMPAGGSALPPSIETVQQRKHFIYQEGAAVFKHAVSDMASATEELMERNSISAESVRWLVPHQANLRIIDAVAQRVNIPKEKIKINIERYGNTSAASTVLCLWELQNDGELQKGDTVILTTFGAGFTWGALYLKWGFDTKKQ